MTNPFTQRGRISEPERFAGRWSELSMLFERLEAGRPVLVSGGPGVGKSSLLTHVMQSAASNLGEPDMRAYYVNLSLTASATAVYRLVVEALGQRGDTLAALEVALLADEAQVLLCLDDAHAALAAGWGAPLLDALARLARSRRLMLVVALDGPAPQLSERFAAIRLGAFGPPEVRLLAEAYLDGTDVQFTPAELRSLAELSASHPSYLQRAAYHLFESKHQPGLDWRAAYLAEARERPVPGAPLPPEVFSGAAGQSSEHSTYGEEHAASAAGPALLALPEADDLAFGAPLLLGALLWLLLGSPLLGIAVAILGTAGMVALRYRQDGG